MIKFSGITDAPIQKYTIPFKETSAVFTLRFYKTMWCFDVEYKNKVVRGVKLSLGIKEHIPSANLPFDFMIKDTSNMGVDPFKVDDFSSGRIVLYMWEPEELKAIRGYDVPL